ncbi:MAG: hypothetical protein IPO40_07960 [Fibrobacteres bacterium]|nr:hypothetical protein [Fibrobacterota bacterium]
MRRSSAVLFAAAALGAVCTPIHADESTFKAYGFADVQLTSQWYSESNFLRFYGIVTPNTQVNVNHVNTYFDWKPNQNVRLLAEVSLNRDAAQRTEPGQLVRFDSAAVYRSLYSQAGAATNAGMLQYLQFTPYAGLPAPVLQHLADSLTQDTLSKTVHQIGDGVRAKVAEDRAKKPKNPTKIGKDHGISLPRIHADISISDELNFRVGKFVTPAGIWNVDHGSPAILTVRQPYQTSFFPIFPEAQTGIQAFGKTVAADQDLSYAGWMSTGRGGMDVLGRYDYGQDPQNLDDWAVGTHLQADLGFLDGIRLGGTFHTGTVRETEEWATVPVNSFDVATTMPISDLAKTTVVTNQQQYTRELCYGLDTKVSWKKLLVQGEINHRKVLNLMNGDKETDFNGWYILVSRTFPIVKNLEVAPYAMHESIGWSDVENNPSLELSGVPMKGFETWVAGLNFGIYSNIRLKIEYSHVGIDQVNFSSGDLANTYSDSDLGMDEFDAQLSVGF